MTTLPRAVFSGLSIAVSLCGLVATITIAYFIPLSWIDQIYFVIVVGVFTFFPAAWAALVALFVREEGPKWLPIAALVFSVAPLSLPAVYVLWG